MLGDSVSPLFLQKITQYNLSQIAEEHILQRRQGRIAFRLQDQQHNKTVFVKQSWPRHWRETLKYLIRPTRSSREYQGWKLLNSLDLPQPRLLAVGECRNAGRWRRSWLVYEFIENAQTLRQLAETTVGVLGRRTLIKPLAELVACLHNQQIYYADLHSGNILVPDSDGPQAKPLLVDAYEMRQKAPLLYAQRVDDLARLNGFVNASRQARLQFLSYYRRQVDFPVKDGHRLLHAVDERTRQLWQHYRRKRGINYRQYD